MIKQKTSRNGTSYSNPPSLLSEYLLTSKTYSIKGDFFDRFYL